MALYITVNGEKILSYGKNGDIEISSWPSIDGEPANKKDCFWNGSSVELYTATQLLNIYKKLVWKELFGMLKDNLFEIIVNKRRGGNPTFDFDNVITIAQNFRSDLEGYTTKAEVDSARDTAITWMGLE